MDRQHKMVKSMVPADHFNIGIDVLSSSDVLKKIVCFSSHYLFWTWLINPMLKGTVVTLVVYPPF